MLSGAAGLKLGAIQSMDYSWGEINMEIYPMSRELDVVDCLASPAGSYDLDIEPDDIEVKDTVTVVWEIA